MHASGVTSPRAVARSAATAGLGTVEKMWMILIVVAVVALLYVVQVRRHGSRLQRPDNAPTGRKRNPPDSR